MHSEDLQKCANYIQTKSRGNVQKGTILWLEERRLQTTTPVLFKKRDVELSCI